MSPFIASGKNKLDIGPPGPDSDSYQNYTDGIKSENF